MTLKRTRRRALVEVSDDPFTSARLGASATAGTAASGIAFANLKVVIDSLVV
jgi:hypothetical protein